MLRINYIELPSRDVAAKKAFYSNAFGCSFTDFGDDYAATTTGDVDIGLNGDAGQATAAPLPVIEVSDLEAALAAVQGAGGTVVVPIFAYPGGRRFHFRDPAGNELAVYQPE
jgi:predicted enzyme related to lactoylglutathione lyase